MIFLGYLLEIIGVVIWYRLIVRKELETRKINERGILKRTVKLLITHKHSIVNNMLGLTSDDIERKENIRKLEKHIMLLLKNSGWSCIMFIFGPPFAYEVVKSSASNMFIYVILVLGIVVSELRQNTQKFIETMEKYITQVLIPIEKNGDLISTEDSKTLKFEWKDNSKIFLCVMIFFLIIVNVISAYISQIEWSNEAKLIGCVAFTIGIIYLWIKDYRNGRTIHKEKNNQEICFESFEFFLIEEKIEKICSDSGICNVKFTVNTDNIINAYVKKDEDDKYQIIIYQGLLEAFRNVNRKYGGCIEEMFLVTIGHELGHVYYDDIKKYNKRVKYANIISLSIRFCVLGCMILIKFSMAFLLLSMLLMFLNWFVGDIMCDLRYWKQIAELKADRFAIEKIENGRDAFVAFWGNEEKIASEKKKIKDLETSNPLYKYYKRYVENEAHPSIERRIYLVRNRGKWKWWEYIEHAILIRKWIFTRKGWNGR